MRRTRSLCARTTSGHVIAETAVALTKSRRRIASPLDLGSRRLRSDYSRDLRPAEWGSGVSLHGSKPKPLMSAFGQKRTSQYVRAMSALPSIADIGTQSRNVRFVPKADILRCGKERRL